MDYPVIHQGRTVGTCSVRENGLYWELECTCELLSDKVERLYSGENRLGVLEREGERLACRRRLSKASVPQLPPPSGSFSLKPVPARQPWQGTVMGQELSAIREGDTLLFPYDETKPCPCEPLICFFQIADGFWKLTMNVSSSGMDLNGS